MLILSLCLKDSTHGEFLVWKSVPKCAGLKGEMSCSIVFFLQGLSEGSSRYVN